MYIFYTFLHIFYNVISANNFWFFRKQLASTFSAAFPKQNFLSTLSEFSTPTSLSEFTNPLAHEPHQQTERVKMVVWFLRHRLIMQLHTYVYMLLDDDQELDIDQDETENDKQVEEVDENETFDSPMDNSSMSEQNAETPQLDKTATSVLKKLPAELRDMDEDLRLFLRLCKYFNGEHHFEDVMYWENLRRSDLVKMMAKFQSVLATCQHEDKLSAVFMEPSLVETFSWT